MQCSAVMVPCRPPRGEVTRGFGEGAGTDEVGFPFGLPSLFLLPALSCPCLDPMAAHPFTNVFVPLAMSSQIRAADRAEMLSHKPERAV